MFNRANDVSMEHLIDFIDCNFNEDSPLIITKTFGDKDWLTNKTIKT